MPTVARIGRPWKPGECGDPTHRAAKEHWRFQGALRRALAADNGRLLRKAAEQLIRAAARGEPWAIRELADRLDGRAKQSVAVAEEAEPSWIERSRSLVELLLAEVEDRPAVEARRAGS